MASQFPQQIPQQILHVSLLITVGHAGWGNTNFNVSALMWRQPVLPQHPNNTPTVKGQMGRIGSLCRRSFIGLISLKLSKYHADPQPHLKLLWKQSAFLLWSPVAINGLQRGRERNRLTERDSGLPLYVKFPLIAAGQPHLFIIPPLPSFPLADTGSILPPICPQ